MAQGGKLIAVSVWKSTPPGSRFLVGVSLGVLVHDAGLPCLGLELRHGGDDVGPVQAAMVGIAPELLPLGP